MKSNNLKNLLFKISILRSVISRFIIILFRKRKGIELLYLNYSKEYVFDKSFLIINYRFRNAIYYRFGNHFTLEKQIKIFNLKNFDNKFSLIVYGFFRKKTFEIQVKPQYTLNHSNFKTSISNLKIKTKNPNIAELSFPNLNFRIQNPEFRPQNIKTKINSFKLNEYI